MRATDRLCALLDEHGIEYKQSYIEGIAEYTHITEWETQAGNMCTFYEMEDGYPPYFTRMYIDAPTPEQAIAATVGRGTCHDVGFAPYIFECSKCGQNHLRNAAYVDVPNYCPSCGRLVIA